jgi:hypothetical protein
MRLPLSPPNSCSSPHERDRYSLMLTISISGLAARSPRAVAAGYPSQVMVPTGRPTSTRPSCSAAGGRSPIERPPAVRSADSAGKLADD